MSRGSESESSNSRNSSLVRHIREFIGETVTIFTTSGGASGCGFTGVILSVSPCFVRLVTEQGVAPTNPLSEIICGGFDDDISDRGLSDCSIRGRERDRRPRRLAGSVCDIPIDRIAAFCHNAV